jgi:ORF6N domain
MEIQLIQKTIYELRGHRIMFDYDLAMLYGVETRVLNQAVKRNSELFPEDFMFQLTMVEWEFMSSHFVMTSSTKRPKTALPLAFTEHGVTMLATILKSKSARQMSITIVRAFIALKRYIQDHSEFSEKLRLLEEKFDKQFDDVYEVINYLLKKDNQEAQQQSRKRIGFKSEQTGK